MLADTLMQRSKNFVFIGEAGSGKTEVSLNLALAMAGRTERPVHFFDMDQTKPLLRARDSAQALRDRGVTVHFQEQYLDAPVVAPGVRELLADPEALVLLDIGGGSYGSHMIGQFADLLNRDDAVVLYIVNPYRPWSRTREDMDETFRRVMGTARLAKMRLVANPNLGQETSAEDVLRGLERLRRLLPEEEIAFLCALDPFAERVKAASGLPVLGIRLNTLPDWFQLPGGASDGRTI